MSQTEKEAISKQIVEIIHKKNIPCFKVPTDGHGNIILDENCPPEVWELAEDD
jgi:septin family protein